MQTGEMEIIYDESNIRNGAICGICNTDIPNSLIIVRSDWPTHSGSAVMLLDLINRTVEPLLEASIEKPRFFAHDGGAYTNGSLYIADSYQKELIIINTHSKAVVETRYLKHILGETKGMIDSCQTIESITVIP